MKTCPTVLVVPSSTKLGHCGRIALEVIGGSCLVVKLVPRSTSLLMLFVEYSDEGCTYYIGKKESTCLHNMSQSLYLNYDFIFLKCCVIDITGATHHAVVTAIKYCSSSRFSEHCKSDAGHLSLCCMATLVIFSIAPCCCFLSTFFPCLRTPLFGCIFILVTTVSSTVVDTSLCRLFQDKLEDLEEKLSSLADLKLSEAHVDGVYAACIVDVEGASWSRVRILRIKEREVFCVH